MIRYRSRTLMVGEVYFDETPDCRGLDIVLYHQRSTPTHPRHSLYAYTLTVDLTQTPEALLSAMDRSTSYEVRRARDRDGITARAIPVTDDAIGEFVSYYRCFASAKHGRPQDPTPLSRLAAAGLLTLTRAESPTGKPLVYHSLVYARSQGRVRGLYSPSQLYDVSDKAERALVGRANRYLHYWDMLFFKEHGARIFDLGGWYAGTDDEARLRINAFKERLGGRLACGYDCEEPVSLKGQIYLAVREAYWRLCRPDTVRERQRRRRLATHLAMASGASCGMGRPQDHSCSDAGETASGRAAASMQVQPGASLHLGGEGRLP